MTLGSKKDKKNAKDSGGIAAAVTKQAAGRFSSSNGSSANSSRSRPASIASSPPINTPEIKPAADSHVNPAASPLLEALSTTSVSASTAPSMTNEWTRGVLAGSPGNLISLMGESPPTQPSSYEDSGRIHSGWPAQRNYLSASPASPSPPNSVRRPLSFQMDTHYNIGDMPPPPSTAAYRRSSVNSHIRTASNPPLPHHAQAHYYGAPGLDWTLTPQAGMKAGERGYFFGLDRLPSTLDTPHGAETVTVAGYEGGLEVHAVSKRGVTPVGSLRGLRGGVHYAKILPWTMTGDAESIFPLVAVVVHGPVFPQPPADTGTQDGSAPQDRDDNAAEAHSNFPQQDAFHSRPASAIESYQTSVEVYSLRTNKLVDVLLQAPVIPINSTIPLQSPVFQPPPPSGAFTIKADGGSVIVSSGVTGECWIYRHLLDLGTPHRFGCAGKVWTCLQQSFRGEVAEEGEKSHSSAKSSRFNPQTPILAINGRWLAYSPASPSSQITLSAHAPVPLLGRSPGTSSATPPQLPAVTSSLDLAISDSVVNKIMRETTQELIQGAKWVGQQGLQAWNSYWNRSTNPQALQAQQARSPPQQWPGSRSPHGDPGQFPPTHGAAGQALPKEPGLVSILDIEMMSAATSIHPLATFAAPLGCSFLSFSPSSLFLFTASTKGDVQTVWDLMRIQHTKSSPLQAPILSGDSTGPLVRQVAQFSRMTVARIVEVIWAEPQGEQLAMVTERGTVHLMEMPSSASIWPPPRRRRATQDSAGDTPETTGTAVSIASGALGAAYQAAKPFVTRQRRSSGAMPTVTGNTLKGSAAHGGRVIAASITSSIGKTGTAINQLRYSGENRVSLPQSPVLPSAACVTWIRTRKSHALFAVGNGVVRMFPGRLRLAATQPGKRVTRASRYKDYKIPLLPNEVIASAVRQMIDLGFQEEYLDLSDREMDAGNTMTLKARPRITSPDHSLEAAIPQAEIESSAPYQPFHTDRRVALCEYSQGAVSQSETVTLLLANSTLEEKSTSKKKKKAPSAMGGDVGPTPEASVWAFGQDIPVVRRDISLQGASSQIIGGAEDYRPLPASAMERVMKVGDEEQIVVTTRRRRGARQGDPDEDGFFEDDCEVLDYADQRV
ncbi:hypothetical protein S40293_01971 [Stachybotrys chartarum IBT 40293]|nr:hypothetical protein S40293_01971 [Stachybotrys chartarum IBT 40293]